MYKQYSSIVCISDQTYRNLNDYIGSKDKIRTIYNGVGITRFLKPIKNIEGQGQFVITMVAAFREQKDHETLLKAVALLPNNYSLRLVGHGDTELKVKQHCSELGIEQKVTFMGLRMDVSDILESSDVIVLSSHWEGLSLSSIEGMASGRPFVASDVDGLHEIVSGAGVLFPQGDENALSNAIRELCENPAYYKQVAQSCQERAKNYDITKMAQAYHELYESLL
jgi:glycosyltransferase involved in cell wall biosynthesis